MPSLSAFLLPKNATPHQTSRPTKSSAHVAGDYSLSYVSKPSDRLTQFDFFEPRSNESLPVYKILLQIADAAKQQQKEAGTPFFLDVFSTLRYQTFLTEADRSLASFINYLLKKALGVC